MSIKVSVIIPTYKRPILLHRCLEALMNQSVTPDGYEVIVVTDGPDPETTRLVASVVKEYRNCPALRCLSLPAKKGPAAARNLGWRNATGKLILFTDDDCIPLYGWIEHFVQAFNAHQRPEIAFAGKVRVPLPEKPTDYEKNTALLESGSFVTANCCCTKAALEKTGGLDEDFTMAWREDSALEFDLVENNIPIVKIDGAIVVHPVRTAPWGISIKEQKKSMFNPLLYKKHPALYQQKIHKRPPLYYYGIIFFAIGSIIAALIHRDTIMHISLIFCTLLIGWFTYRRLSGASLAITHVAEMIITSIIIPFLSVYWTLYGAMRYKIFFLWDNQKPPVLRSPSSGPYS